MSDENNKDVDVVKNENVQDDIIQENVKKKKEKKPKKKRKWWKTILKVFGIFFLIIILIALYLGFGFTRAGFWAVDNVMPETKTEKAAYEKAIQTVEAIEDEGIVLLQNNDNLLPLKTSENDKVKLNLFGTSAIQFVYNGGGSAATDVTRAIKLEDALRSDKGQFEVNEDLLNLYYNFYIDGSTSVQTVEAPENGSASAILELLGGNIVTQQIDNTVFTDTTLYADGSTVLDKAKEFSDIAVVVISRGSGEGFDMTPSQLMLTSDEVQLLDTVTSNFDNVIVLINSANTLEIGSLQDYEQIKSIVWVGYPGETGTLSIAKVLNGTVNPSGRLSDTWLTKNMNNPASNNSSEHVNDGEWAEGGGFHYNNTLDRPTVHDIKVMDMSPASVGYFNQYSEGIYVGYKYYETRHDTDPSYNYYDDVVYPFGYGLSYTEFEKSLNSVKINGNEVEVTVEVKNVGDYAGKDVVQIYYNPVYTGKIEKATVNLVDFLKTDVLEPNETKTYTLTFALEDMASYDYIHNEAYVLEAGKYEIMLMNGSHDKLDSKEITIDNEIVYSEDKDGKRESDIVVANNQFDNALGVDDYLTREWDSNSRAFTGPKEEDYVADEVTLAAIDDFVVPTDAELGLTSEDMPLVAQKNGLKFKDMVGVDYNDPKWDEFVSQLTLEEMANLTNDGAWRIEPIKRLGVPLSLTPDGSTAVAATVYSGAAMGTSGAGVTYPTPVVLASTWNKDIALAMGTSAGEEAKAFGFNGWYAPSMNIHRTAFNGRNFEYYSEDAVLSGYMSSNVVKGAVDNGVITFIKHFAMNEREENVRSRFIVWSNEQAIREIYLKPFEMAVKEGGSLGIMSSFNYIGLDWAGGSKALLTDVLTEEWGFEGVVITDAKIHPHMETMQMLYAGGDLSLDVMGTYGLGKIKNEDLILEYANNPETQVGTVLSLHQACKDILYAVSRSNIME